MPPDPYLHGPDIWLHRQTFGLSLPHTSSRRSADLSQFINSRECPLSEADLPKALLQKPIHRRPSNGMGRTCEVLGKGRKCRREQSGSFSDAQRRNLQDEGDEVAEMGVDGSAGIVQH